MIALKEWAIICKALEDGRQILLLRKGGIMEYRKGFEVKHNEFLLYPTFEHQSMESIKAEYKEKLKKILEEQNKYTRKEKDKDKGYKNFNIDNTNILKLFAKVEDVVEISKKVTLAELRDYHIWSDEYVMMRMNYNPSKPMSILLLRIYKIKEPLIIDINDKWSGCKSWIDIEKDVDIQNSHIEILKNEKALIDPVLNDDIFYESVHKIRNVIGK
ncbi:MAG TPA: DUF1802 family protein [Nitrososphaeraceae archaeon]